MLEGLAKTMRTIALTTVVVCMLFVYLDHRRREPAAGAEGAANRPAQGGTEAAVTVETDPADGPSPPAGDGPVTDLLSEESPAPVLELPELLFPLPVVPPFGDSFGDPRPGGRRHVGVDLVAPKRTPVHAAAAGRVRWLHDEAGGRCCAVALIHEDGWRTRYIHLDNDAPGTDDGLAVGIAPGLEPGVFVEAGELIGWVGDSGNAEELGPHLHFELRDPEGRPVNATAILREAAQRLAAELEVETASAQ